jgi:hypothetical protein
MTTPDEAVVPIDFWTCDDSPETLTHDDDDEAIEDWLDRFCDPPKFVDGKWVPLSREEQVKNFPERVTLYGYKRIKLDADYILNPDVILERIYEALDEEHNCGDEPTQPTDRVIAAAEVLCRAIREEYVPFNCEQATTREIVVAEWLAAHPEFLADA